MIISEIFIEGFTVTSTAFPLLYYIVHYGYGPKYLQKYKIKYDIFFYKNMLSKYISKENYKVTHIHYGIQHKSESKVCTCKLILFHEFREVIRKVCQCCVMQIAV